MSYDPRTKKLAKIVVDYSLAVKHDENVVISGSTEAAEFIAELYKAVILRGAHPILRISLPELSPFFYRYAKEHQIKKFPDHFDYAVKKAQKYIGIDTVSNTRDLSDADPRKIVAREVVTRPISNYIVNRRDKIWRVTVGFPCMAMAQEAEMSLADYERFVFGATLLDWKKIGENIDKILHRFRKGKEVHLIEPGVDLKFQIHAELAKADKGEENMPGGEVYMAPIRTSMKGWIKFDYPAIESGKEVTDIYLEFKKGKVIKFNASKNKNFLREMLATDKNSSYVGEFGIGCNPKINRFTKNLLFDEKINGTIHLALGMAYKDNGGGNDSAIHWDIVKNMRRGKIVLDGKMIQEKGKWRI